MSNQEPWSEYAEEMNRAFLETFEQNMEMQAQFLESWLSALEDTSLDETWIDGIQGTVRGYEVWMRAAEEQVELFNSAAEGDDVPLEEFRDIWLNAANEAFKEVMGTTAFAAATGQSVGNALDLNRQVDEAAQETLRSFGFATEGDVEEVGKRLVELERRQHAVEQKLDRLIESIEENEEERET
ncbi:poly(R)-hydroxyalkanoic acid synthase subunit [Haloferacaceae archaeon DSL9]